MKYGIVFLTTDDQGETHQKWVPSADYELCAQHLLKTIRRSPKGREFLIIPFILTLAATLEASINDWLMIDTFLKHGPKSYKGLADAYISAPLAKKLRLVVAVLTDNTFQLREDSPVVHTLDKFISTRNKITHPLVDFQVEHKDSSAATKPPKGLVKHPAHTSSVKDCEKYFEAFADYARLFFEQYDNGYVEANDLILELVKIGEQVPSNTPQEEPRGPRR